MAIRIATLFAMFVSLPALGGAGFPEHGVDMLSSRDEGDLTAQAGPKRKPLMRSAKDRHFRENRGPHQSLYADAEAEQKRKPMVRSAKDRNVTENQGPHQSLYVDAEAAMKELPPEKESLRRALHEALHLLRRADTATRAQAESLIEERKAKAQEVSVPFVAEGKGLVGKAIQSLLEGSHYVGRLSEFIREHRADYFPDPHSAAFTGPNVITDCNDAYRRSLEVLRYDAYHRESVPTPDAVKAIALRIVKAVEETKEEYMRNARAKPM
eukprot:CAMPEP_0170629088 /NCGR_PEP_ID=MMETSP0224-20130122/33110_1 /TAXON_ID=285029 /ORGANISM="Togula jolla, Strain CCCM 725" /LENGTH=267 /DNA_ID=CAMNT_0010956715 /DNA_START=100 /DNA_END=903 /DNA_ORIENTATION=-